MFNFNTSKVHFSWLPLLQEAAETLDPAYIQGLCADTCWLPGPNKILNAFSEPVHHTRYILFGESPYPRSESANGCAFWDAAVSELWSDKGLSKPVNRATSLRNIVKMLLVAQNALPANETSQEAIARLDKSSYVQSLAELFQNFQDRGILLLNASLVFRKNAVRKDAAAWLPFMDKLLSLLAQQGYSIELILLGKIANLISELPSAAQYKQFNAEHPYNISFITNPRVLNYFKPLQLLQRK